MHSLENDFLRISVSEKGAELQSVFNKKNQTELLWQGGDPWNRSAPNLFPIVGKLINDTYFFEGKEYKLGQHGFARDSEFALVKSDGQELVFQLRSNAKTRQVYPFHFEFEITCRLSGKSLEQKFSVRNSSDQQDLYTSFGAHPAFNIPQEGLYELRFNRNETVLSNTLENGTISGKMSEGITDGVIELSQGIFDQDALIFTEFKSDSVELLDPLKNQLLTVSFPGFEYLGIWAKPDAPFVCIEPWMGIADFKGHSGELESKAGMNRIKPGHILARTMTITVH